MIHALTMLYGMARMFSDIPAMPLNDAHSGGFFASACAGGAAGHEYEVTPCIRIF